MGYRDNVAAMAARRGLENPLQEKDIRIKRLVFFDVVMSHDDIVIEATDMNRAGRLFLEDAFSGTGFRATSVELDAEFSDRAKAHFAELWDDIGTGKRPLLEAINAAGGVEIEWKNDDE